MTFKPLPTHGKVENDQADETGVYPTLARNIIELSRACYCAISYDAHATVLKQFTFEILKLIMRKFNSLGRSYIPGKPLSGENRELIVRLGGDYITGDFGGNFSDVGRLFGVSGWTAKNIWIRLTQDGTIKHKDKLGAFNPPKLQQEELDLIEVLKHHKPSMPYTELKRTVER